MTKKVVWTSCTRLSCACVTPSPPVILCLTDASLLAPQLCPDGETETTYPFTTLAATLTKSWKLQDVCQKTSWSYVFEYDESLLADPDTALTAAQVEGAFCEGCITTWVRDEVGDEIQVTVDDENATVTITSQHGCETTFSTTGTGGPIVPVDTDSVDLTVSGATGHTLQADVNISADAGNIISIENDGLFAAATADTPITVVDTATLDLGVSGVDSHTLTGSVKISPDAGNATSAHANGIYSAVSPTSVNVGSGCETVGATKMVRSASIAGAVLTITGAPEHTSDVFYSTQNVAALGSIGVGTYNLQDIGYTRTADACRGTAFTDAYGAVSNIGLGNGAQVTARTLTSINGGAFAFSSECSYVVNTDIRMPVMDISRANPSTAIAAGGANQAIVIRFQLIVVAVGTGVIHDGTDCSVSSTRTTR